jgi:hypothetical protein
MKKLLLTLLLLCSLTVSYSQQFKVVGSSNPKNKTTFIRFEGDSVMLSLSKNEISVLNVQEYWELNGVTRYVLYNKDKVYNVRLVKKRHRQYVLFFWCENYYVTYNLKLDR